MNKDFLSSRMDKSEVILKAAKSHFEGEMLRQQANLRIYLDNATGIGEHPDIMVEVITMIKDINEHNDCLELVTEMLEE